MVKALMVRADRSSCRCSLIQRDRVYHSCGRTSGVRLSEIAARLDCVLKGNGNADITGVVGIESAGPGHLTFVSNPKYASKAKTTQAGAIIVTPDFPDVPVATLRHENPYLTFARAIELFYAPPQAAPGKESTARIASTARIGEGAAIG